MTYVSLGYFAIVLLTILLYYILPLNKRWWALVLANAVFYFGFHRTGWWIFIITIVASYCIALLIKKAQDAMFRKGALIIGILAVTIPWMIVKNGQLLVKNHSLIVPLGISFYTLQIIAYLVDVYKKDIDPQTNIFKYFLFVSFFPQIIQGPIPRYSQLQNQLTEGHLFNEEKFAKGFYYIIWGLFLKLMIADKAAVIVNTVFDNQPSYAGAYIWVASILYSIQLYADFLACTTISRGVSKMFGIELIENFNHPYFATSVKDFWRRWHISLSSWLKDYIYIPLGGNRKGTVRKYVNILITFAVSGIWHGAGLKFLIWGIMHAVYQIVESLAESIGNNEHKESSLITNIRNSKTLKIIWTFFWVNLAWIIFRADTLLTGIDMIKSMFTDFNIWVLFDGRIATLGLIGKEIVVLIIAILILFWVSKEQEKGKDFTAVILNKPLVNRWALCIVSILIILVFGTYGYGFSANEFLYAAF